MSTPDAVINGFLTSAPRIVSHEKDGLQTRSRIRTDGRAFAQGNLRLRVQGLRMAPLHRTLSATRFPLPPVCSGILP